jgi:hypothetical protein
MAPLQLGVVIIDVFCYICLFMFCLINDIDSDLTKRTIPHIL